MLKEFKPSLFFLAKFIGIYVIGNILYGLFIESYGDFPDPVTQWVTEQTSWVLNLLGEETRAIPLTEDPIIQLVRSDFVGLNVFEGCNGINVMIVFMAFIVSFGGPLRSMAWYIPVGLLLIHIANLLRLFLLYFVNLKWEEHFYFFHKYLFTASIYVFVFALWGYWIWKFSGLVKPTASHANQP
jgi:exosortase family protein XrtF